MSFTINMDLLNQAREDTGMTVDSMTDQIVYVAPEEDVVVDIFGDSTLGTSGGYGAFGESLDLSDQFQTIDDVLNYESQDIETEDIRPDYVKNTAESWADRQKQLDWYLDNNYDPQTGFELTTATRDRLKFQKTDAGKALWEASLQASPAEQTYINNAIVRGGVEYGKSDFLKYGTAITKVVGNLASGGALSLMEAGVGLATGEISPEDFLKQAAISYATGKLGDYIGGALEGSDAYGSLVDSLSEVTGLGTYGIEGALQNVAANVITGQTDPESLALSAVLGYNKALAPADYDVNELTGLPVDFDLGTVVDTSLDAATKLTFPTTPDTTVDVDGVQLDALPDDPLGNIEASKNYVPPSGGSLGEVTVTAPSTEGGMLTGTTSVSETPLSYDEWYSQQTTPQNLYNLTDKNGNRVDGVYVRKTGETLEVVGDPYLVDQSYGASLLVNEYVPAMQDKLNSGELKIGTEAGFTPEEIQVTAAAEPEAFLENLNSQDIMQPVVKPTKPEEIVVTAPETPIEEPPLVVPELPLDIAKPLDPVIPKVTETEPEQEQPQQDEEEAGGGDASGSTGQLTPSQTAAQQVLQMAVGATTPDMKFDVNNDGRITSADALEIARNYSQYEDLFADTTAEDTVGDTTGQQPVEQPQAPVEQPQEPSGEPQPTYDDGYNTGFTEGAGSVQQQYTRTGENEWQDAEGNVYKYESVGSYDTGFTDGVGSVVQKWEKTGDNEYTDSEGNVFTYEELGSYDTGFDTGYEGGYSAAQEVSPWQQNLENPNEWTNVLTGETVVTEAAGSYDSGYGTGYGEGNEAGYTIGYGEGETVGYDTGYGEGYGTGYGEGEGAGFGRGQGVATTSQSFAGGDMPEFQGYMGGLAYRKLTPYQLQDLIYQPSVVNSLFGDYLK